MIFRATLLGSLALSIAGCDGGPVMSATSSQAAEAQNEGVADDGTPIIFAGARTSAATKNRPAEREERLLRQPNAPDPEQGEFTLEEAVVGLPVDGTLVAEIGTELGTLLCDLYADRAPRAVANFVGLTRGMRPWWDARAGEWVRRPYYGGLPFHRVIPDYLVQGGDYLGDGTGSVGYTLDDEPDDTLSHDRAGQLCMANQVADNEVQPNSAGAQFFITDGPAPQLDRGGSTIFGLCRPPYVIAQIARVPQDPGGQNRPLTPIHISRIQIRRVVGGATAAQPTRPQLPAGEPEEPRGASESPTTLRSRDGRAYPEPSPLPRSGTRGPPRPPIPQLDDGHGH